MNPNKNHFQETSQPGGPAVVFDGGAFTISHLAQNPEGYSVQTVKQMRRTEGVDVGSVFDEEQTNQLREAMRDEVKFNGGESVAEARKKLRHAEDAHEPEDVLKTLQAEFDATRKSYVRKMAGKVGVRNIEETEEGVLNIGVKLVGYGLYKEFGDSKYSDEIHELSAPTGTAMAIVTSDNRLVIQKRAVAKQKLDTESLTFGNGIYPDVAGASVGGLLDATIDHPDRIKGTPDPVDTDSIRANILKESDEELGLALSDVSRLRVVGVAEDKIAIHNEFLIVTDTQLTANELKEKGVQASLDRNLGAADFEESVIDIEASPGAIKVLLTETECPLPPTHAALLVASGYAMVVDKEGVAAANEWKDDLQQKITENYRRIDERVAEFYRAHPEALKRVPERYWNKTVPSRNTQGYSPYYTPQEQGLPSIDDELVRTGLNPEKRKTVQEAFIFDVDGPLTDPHEHKVVHKELPSMVAEILDMGLPVGLNTGRGVNWAIDNFVELVKPHVKDPSSLSNLIVIGEMGGTWATFDKTGEAVHNKSRQLTMSQELKDSIEEFVEQDRYRDVVYFDGGRETMASVIMKSVGAKDDLSKAQAEEVYERVRLELEGQLQALIEASPDKGRIEIGQTAIATDFNSPYAGKDLGAARFEEWLEVKGLKPEHYYTFGDSQSDSKMAEYIAQLGKPGTFVFVGKQLVAPGVGYDVVNAAGYSGGTLRVLNRIIHRDLK